MFGYENKKVYLIYISKKSFEKHIELLLIEIAGNSTVCKALVLRCIRKSLKVYLGISGKKSMKKPEKR